VSPRKNGVELSEEGARPSSYELLSTYTCKIRGNADVAALIGGTETLRNKEVDN